MTQIIEKSINTGAVYVAGKLGEDNFLEYLKRFGIGQISGIDLPAEVAPSFNNLKNNKLGIATASFGQGVVVTPIQILRAIGALANQGRLVKPRVFYNEKDSEMSEPIISSATVAQMTQILVSTVENSPVLSGVKVSGYSLAAKTGTAQVAIAGGKGYSDQYIHNLVAFFPAWNPRFIVLLKINEPKGVETAAFSLSDALGKLMNYLVNYYEILPDEPIKK